MEISWFGNLLVQCDSRKSRCYRFTAAFCPAFYAPNEERIFLTREMAHRKSEWFISLDRLQWLARKKMKLHHFDKGNIDRCGLEEN